MTTADAVVTGIFTIAALLAGFAWYRSYQKRRNNLKRLQVNGVPLIATITQATVLTSGDNSASVRMRLKYNVTGKIAHQGTATKTFNLAQIPREGDELEIYVNRHDANDFVIANSNSLGHVGRKAV